MGAIYLVRHGQASFAAADYDDLSALGREQGRVLGSALAARHVQAELVICGGMRRHAQTAQECLTAQSLAAEWRSIPVGMSTTTTRCWAASTRAIASRARSPKTWSAPAIRAKRSSR